MKTSTVNAHFTNGMSFDIEIGGYKITVDAGKEVGGQGLGPGPKSLMLASLAGCTGMDVVSILNKMRIKFDDLKIEVEGNITEDHPKHFDHMHIKYIFRGKDIPVEKVNSAISLSQEKYCGVSFNYRMAMKITSELIIEE